MADNENVSAECNQSSESVPTTECNPSVQDQQATDEQVPANADPPAPDDPNGVCGPPSADGNSDTQAGAAGDVGEPAVHRDIRKVQPPPSDDALDRLFKAANVRNAKTLKTVVKGTFTIDEIVATLMIMVEEIATGPGDTSVVQLVAKYTAGCTGNHGDAGSCWTGPQRETEEEAEADLATHAVQYPGHEPTCRT